MKFLMRMNCEYSTIIEAGSKAEAREIAEREDIGKMEQAWSEVELEEA